MPTPAVTCPTRYAKTENSYGLDAVVMDTFGHSQASLTLDAYSPFLPGFKSKWLGGWKTRLAVGGSAVPSHEHQMSAFLGKEVTQIFTSWNQMGSWLRQLQELRRAA